MKCVHASAGSTSNSNISPAGMSGTKRTKQARKPAMASQKRQLKAYALQDKGYDTVDANLALGLPSEAREYGAAVSILRDLGVESVRLMTTNPAKSSFLNEAGIKVNSFVPVIVGAATQNEQYLETKRARMGHMIPEGK